MTRVLIGVLISALVILLLREVWTWYWKINKITKLLQEQLEEQKRTNQILKKMIHSENNQINQIDHSVND